MCPNSDKSLSKSLPKYERKSFENVNQHKQVYYIFLSDYDFPCLLLRKSLDKTVYVIWKQIEDEEYFATNVLSWNMVTLMMGVIKSLSKCVKRDVKQMS